MGRATLWLLGVLTLVVVIHITKDLWNGAPPTAAEIGAAVATVLPATATPMDSSALADDITGGVVAGLSPLLQQIVDNTSRSAPTLVSVATPVVSASPALTTTLAPTATVDVTATAVALDLEARAAQIATAEAMIVAAYTPTPTPTHTPTPTLTPTPTNTPLHIIIENLPAGSQPDAGIVLTAVAQSVEATVAAMPTPEAMVTVVTEVVTHTIVIQATELPTVVPPAPTVLPTNTPVVVAPVAPEGAGTEEPTPTT